MKKPVLMCVLIVACLLYGVPAFPKVDVKIYYPVQVAGPLTRVIDQFVKEFNESQKDIEVTAVYAGNYDQTMQKAQTAFMSGNPPEMAILRTTSVLNLIDMGAIVPLNDFIKAAGGETYLGDFYPAFINSVRRNGKIWGIPYQISTPLFYYNKEMLKEAGLDPGRAPEDWSSLVLSAEKLTKRDANGNVIRYGLGFPDNNQWMLQSWALTNGGDLADETGTHVFFNTKPVIESLQLWVKLVHEKQVSIRHRAYGKLASDFIAGQVAMMYNSTGSLSFVRKSAKFDFGVSYLPKNKRNAVPLGGAHLFVFQKTSDAKQKASWEFIKWLSSPENAARWSIESGYIAPRKSAMETPAMKEYVKKFPEALTALKQVEFSYPWWTVYEWDKVTKVLETQLANAVDGKISAEQAMTEAQNEAEKILSPYRKR